MRVIKFRVYCEFEIGGQVEKCMESPASWFLLTQTGEVMEYGPMRPPQKTSPAYKKLIPLFFTGAHDKNGKEVFEGDILKHNKAIVQILWNEKEAYFQAATVKGDYSLVFGGVEECEIIGNIYENPELLK
jgi:hypothetical protein